MRAANGNPFHRKGVFPSGTHFKSLPGWTKLAQASAKQFSTTYIQTDELLG